MPFTSPSSSVLRVLGCLLAFACLPLAAPRAEAQSILYICGDEKGYAGLAFDHGLIDYVRSYYTGATLTPTLSDEVGASPQGLYDPDNPAVTQSYDFDTFDCIILSSTVSLHYVPQLMTDLNNTTTSLLVLSEESLVDLRMVENSVSFAEQTTAHDGNSQIGITNYPGQALLGFGSNYWPEAEVYAWQDGASNTGGVNAFFFGYEAGDTVDSGPDTFTMRGDRTFLGLSEGTNVSTTTTSGVWTDTIDNDLVDDAENFDPDVHLTAEGKAMLDQALGIHPIPEPHATMLALLAAALWAGARRRAASS